MAQWLQRKADEAERELLLLKVETRAAEAALHVLKRKIHDLKHGVRAEPLTTKTPPP